MDTEKKKFNEITYFNGEKSGMVTGRCKINGFIYKIYEEIVLQ